VNKNKRTIKLNLLNKGKIAYIHTQEKVEKKIGMNVNWQGIKMYIDREQGKGKLT
jgi:hypothetical protein